MNPVGKNRKDSPHNRNRYGYSLELFGRRYKFLLLSRGNKVVNFYNSEFTLPAPTGWGMFISSWKLDDIATGIETPNLAGNDTRIYGVQGGVVVNTEEPIDVYIYNITGALVKQIKVTGNETIELPKGIYIANKQKVMVY